MHQPLGSAADTFSLEESQLRSLVLIIAVTFGVAGCTLIQKAVTGAAAGGTAG
jgi:hypothetical protein